LQVISRIIVKEIIQSISLNKYCNYINVTIALVTIYTPVGLVYRMCDVRTNVIFIIAYVILRYLNLFYSCVSSALSKTWHFKLQLRVTCSFLTHN